MSRRRGLACAALLLLPCWAEAHSPIPGIGRFYNGALHPFLEPAHAMALFGLGLLIGQRGIAQVSASAVALLLALAVGLALTVPLVPPGTDAVLLAASAIVAVLVALARPLPKALLAGIAVAIGLAVGLGSSPEGVSGAQRWTTLAGTCCGATIGTLWIAAMVEFAQRPWLRVAVRVVASWVAASAVLVLALSWVGQRRVPQAQHPVSYHQPEWPLMNAASAPMSTLPKPVA